MKKYEFTGEVKTWLGHTLHQIRATISFGDVRAGDLGGWIEKKENLDACVSGNAWVSGNAKVFGNAWVSGNAKVSGDAWVYGNACVSGDAKVFGNAKVSGNACVSGDAWVCAQSHYLTVGPIGSRGDSTTFFRTKNLGIFVTCGCFRGSVQEFADKVKQTHGENNHAKQYMLAIELAKASINLTPEA